MGLPFPGAGGDQAPQLALDAKLVFADRHELHPIRPRLAPQALPFHADFDKTENGFVGARVPVQLLRAEGAAGEAQAGNGEHSEQQTVQHA